MSSIYLCGHTGSQNRGCEAILRSTAYILNQLSEAEVKAMTFDYSYDSFLELDKALTLFPYKSKDIFVKTIAYLKRKLFNDGIWGSRYVHRELFARLKPNDIVFNVGGDTYCYSTPYISYALNDMAEESGIPSVFWGCSVDERLLKNDRMIKDINKYSYIVTRESLSYNILKQSLTDDKKLYLACDPAFLLECKKTELPENFKDNNTVGINLSPLVFSDCDNSDDIMYQNVYCLIDYILSNTQMNVCLVPHVYNIERNTQDIKVLRIIYDKYKNTNRLSVIDRELSCTQLKYIVSKCRFFIGARTHTMIAAYSSSVPALALSYSIKSVGIAKDIFGDIGKLVISHKDLLSACDLKNIFVDCLLNKEADILKRYKEFLPDYKKTILTATEEILNGLNKEYNEKQK